MPKSKKIDIEELLNGEKKSSGTRRKTSSTKKEAQEFGRVLGAAASSDPTVMKIIHEEEARTGLPPHEIVKRAIKDWRLLQWETMQTMKVGELYEAWLILREMMQFNSQIFFDFAKVFFRGTMGTFAELVQEAAERQAQRKPPLPIEMKERMWKSFEPMMEMLTQQIGYWMARAMGIKMPAGQKIKVPVNIKVKNKQ